MRSTLDELAAYRSCAINSQFMILPVSLVDRLLSETRRDATLSNGYADDDLVKALTHSEYIIYRVLLRAKGEVVSFGTLCKEIGNDDCPALEDTLWVHTCRLRKKLKELRPGAQLLTAREFGYWLE